MTPSDSTTGIDEQEPTTEAAVEDAPEEIDDEDWDDLGEIEEEPAEPTDAPPPFPSAARRALSAVLSTVVFELLYLVGILIIAFASAGFVAVGPTLQSVVVSPFMWAPAVVFLVLALVVAVPLRGAPKARALTGLLVAIVTYVGATFLVLLVAAGFSAMDVFVQELSVYPFFLAAIVAREVMVWSRFDRPRLGRRIRVAAPVA